MGHTIWKESEMIRGTTYDDDDDDGDDAGVMMIMMMIAKCLVDY